MSEPNTADAAPQTETTAAAKPRRTRKPKTAASPKPTGSTSRKPRAKRGEGQGRKPLPDAYMTKIDAYVAEHSTTFNHVNRGALTARLREIRAAAIKNEIAKVDRDLLETGIEGLLGEYKS